MLNLINFDIGKVSPNHSSRKNTRIDTLIIHHMGIAWPEGCDLLCDGDRVEGRVSAHYFIRRTGQIYQLVTDDRKAWHAGISSADINNDGKITKAEKGLNARSIGIELEYLHESYTDEELTSNVALTIQLRKRYNIQIRNILGHKEVAPGRKTDPANFDMSAFRELIQEASGI